MLTIGMDLTIETDRNGMVKKYKSKVADIQQDKLYIYYPLSVTDNKPAFLPSGSKVIISFISGDSNVFLFESKVLGMQKSAVTLVELYLPEEKYFNRVQRREHVRVIAGVNVVLDFPNSGQKFKSVTSDISAGGCAVIVPPDVKVQPAESGTIELSILMESGEQFQLTFTCEVIRIFTKNKLDLMSLKYIEPTPSEQQLLTRFCFERQLSDRKKGLYI
ncbi:flagellar brake protein [Siminovitchia acidinfaciens]|nr:flagellar brake domain-containing protein [Siminovitchia acidinfaciens]